ncbi:MAG: hydroxymethylbilane synthase [Alphaproteobacteria bacterium]|nr:hydroxymethylbilane synthase [Alphaproteobacteria bacterium]
MTKPLLRIGTRGSPLALAQAALFREQIIAAWPDLGDPGALETVVIKTTGDRIQDRPLSAIGGKGLFTKELDEALRNDVIDVAIHSAKDLPATTHEDLLLGCTLEREDPRDALISRVGAISLGTSPKGSSMGTSALRRASQVLSLRDDIQIRPLRGNVDTRLRKLESGEMDAIILAAAGLKRLGLEHRISGYFDPVEILPAVGQGVIGVVMRSDDDHIFEYLQPLDHMDTHNAIMAERSMLHQLEGNCRTPIAGLAVIEDDRLVLHGLVATLDGVTTWRVQSSAPPAEAFALGREVGRRLQEMAGDEFPRLP